MPGRWWIKQSVPILENDTALDVSIKVAEAAQRCCAAACRA